MYAAEKGLAKHERDMYQRTTATRLMELWKGSQTACQPGKAAASGFGRM
jgi:hypothetical protein